MIAPQKSNDLIVCADWGTSSLRIYLVDLLDGTIIDSFSNDQGILSTFQQWQKDPGADRKIFYRNKLQLALDQLSVGASIIGIPLIASGMAGSSIGIQPIDYSPLPFDLNRGVMGYHFFEATIEHSNPLWILSGLEKPGDVMRGEEVQAMGWWSHFGKSGLHVLVLPGTHSKHLWIQDGVLVDFHSYFTGELYRLLLDHSILKPSVEEVHADDQIASRAFLRGLDASSNHHLLQELFRIRAKSVQQHLSPGNLPHYLSGLLIGSELRSLNDRISGETVHLAAGSSLIKWYLKALDHLGFENRINWAPGQIDQFTLTGQIQAWKRL